MATIGSDECLKRIAATFAGETLCKVARANKAVQDIYRNLVAAGYLRVRGTRYIEAGNG